MRQITFHVFPELIADPNNRIENWRFDIFLFEVEFKLTVKPSHHLLLGLRAERTDVDLEQGRFYKQLFGSQADHNCSPNVSWANIVQHNSESRILGFQTRFRWLLKPGNNLFLVLNWGLVPTYEHAYVSAFDRGTIKLQYTFMIQKAKDRNYLAANIAKLRATVGKVCF